MLLDARAVGGAGGAPADATFIVQTPTATLTNEQALSALATGILKSTTGTGVISIAAEGTDYFNPPFLDTNTLIKGSADPTKLLRFEIDGFTAGATRVLTPPNQDVTLAGQNFANVFTVAQTIDGSADAIQLIVQSSGNPQTANLLELQSSTGAIYTYFSAIGNLRIGSGASTGSIAIGSNDPDPTRFGLSISRLFAAAGTTQAVSGEWGNTSTFDTFGMDYTGRAHHSSGTMSNLVGLRAAIRKSNAGGVTAAVALLARAPTLASTGVIDNNYGLKVESQNGTNVSTAYAIHTSIGLIVFNETGDSTSDVRIEGDTNTHLLFTDADVDCVGINDSTPDGKLDVVQSSTTAAIPVLVVEQADVSEEFIRFIGSSANGVLTQSIIENADVGASALQGWLKVFVQDDGNQLADQAYFIPIYTLT